MRMYMRYGNAMGYKVETLDIKLVMQFSYQVGHPFL